MTDYTNIDLFRIYSGTTFALLYEAFPLSKKLEARELIEHCSIATDQPSRTAHEEIVNETWRWLRETAYLRYDPNTETYDLTPRSFEGLTFLDKPNEGICRGDQLRQLTKKVGGEAVSETIAEIVTQILGTGARAAFSMFG